MKSYKIYIVGNITADITDNCEHEFEITENLIRDIGATPVSPFKLGIPFHTCSPDAIPHCNKAIRNSHAIFLLDNHIKSPRAIEEVRLANQLQLNVYSDCQSSFDQILEVLSIRITG